MSGSLTPELLQRLVQMSPDGIAICEKGADGWPVVFVNEAFEKLTGYKAKELQGRDLRLLQAEDREQETRQRIRQAMADGTTCRVLMRNYRIDGTRFWNEMTLVPIRNAKGDLPTTPAFIAMRASGCGSTIAPRCRARTAARLRPAAARLQRRTRRPADWPAQPRLFRRAAEARLGHCAA